LKFEKEKMNITTTSHSPAVELFLVPVFETDVFGDKLVVMLKVHFINRSNEAYLFRYHVICKGEVIFELNSEIVPHQNFYLHDQAFSSLNDNPSFQSEFSLVVPNKNKVPYYETSLKLKPKQVFASIDKMVAAGETGFSYPFLKDYPRASIEEKTRIERPTSPGYKLYDASTIRQHLPAAKAVIDLHIEQLTEDWRHLNNFEMLTLQLAEFEQYYDLAVVHRQHSFIVIHGVGKGKLKEEIHDRLRMKKEVKHFANQYHPSFGYGATEIYFHH
jgi:hypothetical protein